MIRRLAVEESGRSITAVSVAVAGDLERFDGASWSVLYDFRGLRVGFFTGGVGLASASEAIAVHSFSAAVIRVIAGRDVLIAGENPSGRQATIGRLRRIDR